MSTTTATNADAAAAPAAPKTALDPIRRVESYVESLKAKNESLREELKAAKQKLQATKTANSRVRRIPKPVAPETQAA